jgi:membrane protein YdbS with pleckstrin-like domain
MAVVPPPSGDPFDPVAAEWRPAQPGLLKVRLLGTAITAVLILVAAVIVFVASRWPWAWLPAGLLLAVTLPQLALIPRRVRAIGWAVRDRDLFYREGVMFRRLTVVPYTRVQYVDISAGPIERAFGLTTLKVNTAAASSAVTVPGLSPEEAARLRETLTDKSKLDPAA